MLIQEPHYQWEARQRKSKELRVELEAYPSDRLQGIVETYEDMQPFTALKSLFGSHDSERLNLGRLILTKRELSELTRRELKNEAQLINPIRDFCQYLEDFLAHNPSYARREIATDLLGKRKGLPYFG